MNKLKHIFLAILISGGFYACDQEAIVPEVVTPPTPEEPTGTSGSANFTKYVSIGNSLTAGMQGNALFNRSQAQSFPAILNRQFAIAGGNATFNQPSINSENGFTGFGPGGTVLGRLVLQQAPGGSPAPAPLPGDLITPFTGDKSTLNNFGAPGILLGQVLTPLTGGPQEGNPAFNPYYARFATAPGSSTIIGDVLATQPTFFTAWIGNNDVLGYAVNGGCLTCGPPITDENAFRMQYQAMIGTLMQSNPDLKGAVGTIPNILIVPFFNLIPYNAIPLDEATATVVNGAYAGYNQLVGAAAQNGFIGADEFQRRQVVFQAGANAAVIDDEGLTDLGPFFDFLVSVGQIDGATRASLEPLRRARQAVAGEKLPLPAASVLGTLADPNNPLSIRGVAVPLADRFVLTLAEIDEINAAVLRFNSIIEEVAASTNDRVAVANFFNFTTNLASSGPQNIDGVVVTPNFAPPSGVFSEDGVHPNSRGYALAANEFIKAINAKFGATIPLAKVSDYPSNDLPRTIM